MPHGYMNWDAGWMWEMHLLWWLVWVVLAVIIWWIIDRSAGRRVEPRESSLETLRRRYAEGALTSEEYEERRGKLTEAS